MAKKLYVRNNDNTEWVPLATSIPNASAYATYEYVDNELANIDLISTINTASAAAVTAIVDSAPETLNTLNELAAALNDDSNFASTIATSLGNKLDISSASTTYATINSPTFTGTPLSTTAAVDTDTTQVATTAFVLNQAGDTSPIVNGTASAGTSDRYSRENHVHPTDTSRAALASPTFTGTPAAPTAAVGTNTTQVATTAYVKSQFGSGGVPFRMAANSTFFNTGVTAVTVTLPAGRFTQAPIITTSATPTGNVAMFSLVYNVTTSSFTQYLYGGSYTAGTISAYWIAVQMTSGAAGG